MKKTGIMFVVAALFAAVLTSCEKKTEKEECYECVLRCVSSIYQSETKEFCGKDAQDSGELWLTQKVLEAMAAVTNSEVSYEQKTIAFHAISTSECTKKETITSLAPRKR